MEAPSAATYAERVWVNNFRTYTRDRIIYWVVDNCPLCGGEHRHGPAEGLRAAHCGKGYYVLLPPRRRSRKRELPFRQVWDRDGWQCVFCGSHRELTVDHIIPVSKGGTDGLDNLQTACKSCNSSKGDRDAPIPRRERRP